MRVSQIIKHLTSALLLSKSFIESTAASEARKEHFFLRYGDGNGTDVIFSRVRESECIRINMPQNCIGWDKLQSMVTAAYKACNGTKVNDTDKEGSLKPNQQQIDAMTEKLNYASVGGSSSQFQITFSFDPNYLNSFFIQCFNQQLTQQLEAYRSRQNNKVYLGFVLILAVFAAFLCLFRLGCSLYNCHVLKEQNEFSGCLSSIAERKKQLFDFFKKEEKSVNSKIPVGLLTEQSSDRVVQSELQELKGLQSEELKSSEHVSYQSLGIS